MMNISIREYKDEDKETVIKLFEDFLDFLMAIDHTKRLRKLPEYGEKTLQKTLDDVTKQNGVFYVALANNKVIGFVMPYRLLCSDESRKNAPLSSNDKQCRFQNTFAFAANKA